MVRLSPGILVSSHIVLKKMQEHESYDVMTQCSRSRSIDGTKSVDVVDTIRACEWIYMSDGIIRLAPRGVQIANSFDSITKRLMIGDYISKSAESWISLLPRGRKECVQYLPPDVHACLKGAGLLVTPVPDDVVLWWDQQSQSIRKEQELSTLETGRIGEKLTLEYERERTGTEPVWKSIESNLAGYDVLSIVERNNTARLPIEVKTSEKSITVAVAYITRCEWDVAVESVNHEFHFWHIAGGQRKLAVLNVADLRQHIPLDEGEGMWQNATIPFEVFSDRFKLFSD